jgi:protease-4
VSGSRAVRLVFGLLALAVAVSAAAMLVLFMSIGREPVVATGSTLRLQPQGDLPEVAPEVFLPVGRAERMTVRSYVDLIRKAKADRRVARLLVRPGALESPFWAKLQEIREALVDFKRSGKPVYAFLESAGDRQYYLASAADRVFLLPTSTLDLTGLATYEVFLRGTFDWIGTYPDFLHVGDYKTAVNTFMEKTFTPAHREMSASLNRDQYDQLVRAIADGRNKSEAEVRSLIDRGPFLPEDALGVGLVDDLAYEDELDDVQEGLDEKASIDVDDYAAVSWRGIGVARRSTIAVVNAVGTIVSGRGGYDPVNGELLGSDSIVEELRELRTNKAIKAVVLRIDSPGGSSVASDVIWRELTITKSERLPIVVSMSDLAASGGYYIATAGDLIVAQPGTLTGSIGVYTGKFVTGGTFDKLGANIEATSQGRHAEMYSPDRRFTDEERAKVQESMQATYDQFVEKVAESRHTTPEKIDQIAQGRVWTGKQAKDAGLVDQLGGLSVAINAAKLRAHIPVDEEVDIVVYPRPRSWYQLVSDEWRAPSGNLRMASAAEAFLSVLGPRDRRSLAALIGPSRIFRAGELLKHMPYVFTR